MSLFRFILLAAALFTAPIAVQSADHAAAPAGAEPVMSQATPEQAKATAEHAKGEHEEGIPPYATPIFHIGPLAVTNSMIVTWVVALILIVGAQTATRNIKDVPSGSQNFWEWLVESLQGFLEGIVGYEL